MNIVDNRKNVADIEVKAGDILEVSGFGLRMVVKDEGKYSCVDFEGLVQLDWHSSIDDVVDTYKRWGATVNVIKSGDIELILKGIKESKGE